MLNAHLKNPFWSTSCSFCYSIFLTIEENIRFPQKSGLFSSSEKNMEYIELLVLFVFWMCWIVVFFRKAEHLYNRPLPSRHLSWVLGSVTPEAWTTSAASFWPLFSEKNIKIIEFLIFWVYWIEFFFRLEEQLYSRHFPFFVQGRNASRKSVSDSVSRWVSHWEKNAILCIKKVSGWSLQPSIVISTV